MLQANNMNSEHGRYGQREDYNIKIGPIIFGQIVKR